jgi:hypothetical protein
MFLRPTDATSTKLFVDARVETLRAGSRPWRRRLPRGN